MDFDVPEEHPFNAFIPEHMTVLVVGSFPGKTQTTRPAQEGAWFYGAPRNQFWRIFEIVYDRPLKTRKDKEELFRSAGIGITDIIQSAIRKEGNNSDDNLEIIKFNTETIVEILSKHHPRILFTSRFVEKLFRRLFNDYDNTCTLPSPSPRYYRIRLEEKARIYKAILPGLKE